MVFTHLDAHMFRSYLVMIIGHEILSDDSYLKLAQSDLSSMILSPTESDLPMYRMFIESCENAPGLVTYEPSVFLFEFHVYKMRHAQMDSKTLWAVSILMGILFLGPLKGLYTSLIPLHACSHQRTPYPIILKCRMLLHPAKLAQSQTKCWRSLWGPRWKTSTVPCLSTMIQNTRCLFLSRPSIPP